MEETSFFRVLNKFDDILLDNAFINMSLILIIQHIIKELWIEFAE
jgi:hypothetical protein